MKLEHAQQRVDALYAEEDQSVWGRLSAAELQGLVKTLSSGRFVTTAIPDDAEDYEGFNLRWTVGRQVEGVAVDMRQALIDAITALRPPASAQATGGPEHDGDSIVAADPAPSPAPTIQEIDYRHPALGRLKAAIATAEDDLAEAEKALTVAQGHRDALYHHLAALYTIQG